MTEPAFLGCHVEELHVEVNVVPQKPAGNAEVSLDKLLDGGKPSKKKGKPHKTSLLIQKIKEEHAQLA